MNLISPWRITSVCALLFAAASLVAPARAATVVRTIVGDLDGDGKVGVADAARALRFSVGLATATEADIARGDVSPTPGTGSRAGLPIGDGKVGISDVIAILRHAVSLPGGPWADPANSVSFARVHKEIFLGTCATSSCHNSNSRRAGLDLEDPVQAYALLVNHDSTTDSALARGVKRVVPGSAETSFLMTKLTGPPIEDDGQRMPYGSDGLASAKIDLVRRWIANGAKFDADDGTVKIDESNPTPDPKAVDVSLPVPPPDKGFQITVGPFDVPRGSEIQRDFFLQTPNTEGRWIKRVDYSYNKGSHHLLVFKSDSLDLPDHVETTFGAFPALQSNKWDLITAAQNEAVSSDFPKGIGVFMTPGQQMDFQLHYVNGAAQTTPTGRGKMVANFWYADANEITARAAFLFGTKIFFALPPKKETVLSRGFIFPEDVKVFAMVGHYHSRGRRYRIYRWDNGVKGDIVYESQEWDDPKYKTFDPPLSMKAGQGLLFEGTYDNNTDHIIRDGPHAETEEHLFYWAWFYREGQLGGKDFLDAGL